MKLKLLFAVVLVAAMGPGKSAPPPVSVEPVPSDPVETAPLPPDPLPPAPGIELQIVPGNNSAPGDFLWQSRVVVVFADTPNDPAFTEQIEALKRRPEMLIERDVVVIADSDESSDSDWRDMLHPRGFSLVLIDKDGQVKQRKPSPWSVREITRAIDKFPLRRQEIDRNGMSP